MIKLPNTLKVQYHAIDVGADAGLTKGQVIDIVQSIKATVGDVKR